MCSTVKLPIHIEMLKNILSKKIIPFLSLFRFCQLKIADRVDKNGTYLYNASRIFNKIYRNIATSVKPATCLALQIIFMDDKKVINN